MKQWQALFHEVVIFLMLSCICLDCVCVKGLVNSYCAKSIYTKYLEKVITNKTTPKPPKTKATTTTTKTHVASSVSTKHYFLFCFYFVWERSWRVFVTFATERPRHIAFRATQEPGQLHKLRADSWQVLSQQHSLEYGRFSLLTGCPAQVKKYEEGTTLSCYSTCWTFASWEAFHNWSNAQTTLRVERYIFLLRHLVALCLLLSM